jgi:hypothetical protein
MRMVMKRPIVAFLSQLLLAIRSRFTQCARLEAENIFLRQQLIVIRRKSSTCARLRNIDRLLLVWLYGLIEFGLDLGVLVAAANLFELLLHRTMKLAIHARLRKYSLLHPMPYALDSLLYLAPPDRPCRSRRMTRSPCIV